MPRYVDVSRTVRIVRIIEALQFADHTGDVGQEVRIALEEVRGGHGASDGIGSSRAQVEWNRLCRGRDILGVRLTTNRVDPATRSDLDQLNNGFFGSAVSSREPLVQLLAHGESEGGGGLSDAIQRQGRAQDASADLRRPVVETQREDQVVEDARPRGRERSDEESVVDECAECDGIAACSRLIEGAPAGPCLVVVDQDDVDIDSRLETDERAGERCDKVLRSEQVDDVSSSGERRCVREAVAQPGDRVFVDENTEAPEEFHRTVGGGQGHCVTTDQVVHFAGETGPQNPGGVSLDLTKIMIGQDGDTALRVPFDVSVTRIRHHREVVALGERLGARYGVRHGINGSHGRPSGRNEPLQQARRRTRRGRPTSRVRRGSIAPERCRRSPSPH